MQETYQQPMKNRRSFLRRLVGACVVAPTAALPIPDKTDQEISLHECYLAGLRYYDAFDEDVVCRLVPGILLECRREPHNEYDARAIAIYTAKGRKLGYLPRWINKIPCHLMDSGHRIRCVITKVNVDDTPEHCIKVKLLLM